MAFDQTSRNRLQKFVADARTLLSAEFTRQLQGLYGIDPVSGNEVELDSLKGLSDADRETAGILRQTARHYRTGSPAGEAGAAIERIIREQAFTVLNRLCALRMAEARLIVTECVGKGSLSTGFQMYATLAGSALGERMDAYRLYLFGIFDELSVDLAVLFDRHSPMGRLFPSNEALGKLLDLINAPELSSFWVEDETIGWIYQYFNSKDERKKMRDESAAPRNSRELAVRNQFFTPRYVVEFLTDNTLGRIWYEMCQGETGLKEQCRYLVRRPTEIFLKPGESTPEQPKQENLSQEDLLKQPVHIPHRPVKDPRTILMLDPACGSMHFGLYAFDLFEVIYDEAWALEEKLGVDVLSRSQGMKSIHDTYISKDAFLKDIPRLIIEQNLHGIDIDPRCAQIAGLSLWLRAQKAWQRIGLKPAERPSIKRSNIVCAEPMPGEKELLRDFVERGFKPAERGIFLRLLEGIWDKMQLAGEAGSLLKIEEEISSSIEEAKAAWQKLQAKPSELFSTDDLNELRPQKEMEFSGELLNLGADFFEGFEERIYAALRDYAKEAETGGGFQRRLFAEDAARGFAFIDVCRKRYDVILMNPPFGAAVPRSDQFLEERYAAAKSDLFACFVYRMTRMLRVGGSTGVISARTGFFLQSLKEWRRSLMSDKYQPTVFADLGGGVLDTAMVETSAYVVSFGATQQVSFLNATSAAAKEPIIRNAVDSLRQGIVTENTFSKRPSFFESLPQNVWAYWVSEKAIAAFGTHPPIEPSVARVCVGVQTNDDFRYFRLWWEVPNKSLGVSLADSHSGRGWISFLKGGSSSPFFSDIVGVLNWFNDGTELKEFITICEGGGHWSRKIINTDYFYRPGLSWALRTNYLSPHIVPEGCIPSVSRYLAITKEKSPLALVAYLNSPIYDYLVKLTMEKWLQPKFIVSSIKRLPFPTHLSSATETLIAECSQVVTAQISLANNFEESRYALPLVTCGQSSIAEMANRLLRNARSANELRDLLIEKVTQRLYAVFKMSSRDLAQPNVSELNIEVKEEQDGLAEVADADEFGIRLISFVAGVALGRWDIRYATGERSAPDLPDPFAPLPVCPPGQLQNAQGLSASPEDVPSSYPVKNIPWDGILVDDPNHPLDIERRVREVIEIIWKDRAEAIEHEAYEILGVKALRDYFRKPSAFFTNHLKRYSKSRRQAPIYWPLSTASGSYTLWIYYHRLDGQTLYTCINNFVQPKMDELVRQVQTLKTDRKTSELATVQDFLGELEELKQELLSWAPRWKPNLNDGVIITAAPLFKLFRLPKWRKDLETCWKALERGDYDWAHLAYTLWPERVREKCRTDKSLAIAHGLETLYVEPVGTVAKKKRAKQVVEPELDDINE